jgi:signal transduction histidine kinase
VILIKSMEKLYIKLPMDIKIMIPVLLICLINELVYNVIPHYNLGLYCNFIILATLIFILPTYLFIKDIILIISRKRSSSKFILKKYLVIMYTRLPMDIKIIIPILLIFLINELRYNVIVYYDGGLYSNFIILSTLIFVILTSLFIKDIILIIRKKQKPIKFMIKEFLVIVINKIKQCYMIKATGVKVSILILLTILALVCIKVIIINYYYWPYNIVLTAQTYVILYMILLTAYIITILGEVNVLKIKSNQITNGEYEKEVKDNQMIILKDIEKNIINIEDGLRESVSKAIKSERMKSELITNVSHDLKTPLTSIINYVGLLKEENLSQEKRDKYIDVLDIKSKRLKILIEDLFEASKVASGSIELQKEDLNIVSLLRQILGELEEKISLAELNIITKWPDEKTMLFLDGRKTFRAFENLINNIIKYSMKKSRVYIEVISEEKEVSIIMKNISSYQLDFTAEEIVERFKRGDKSRSTEGSGLGLAIAKSIIELQGGTFDIEIDGDLFKVITTFEK